MLSANFKLRCSTPLTFNIGCLTSRNDLAISTNGLCGDAPRATCLNPAFGDSCSVWGFCGSCYKAEFAGTGCRADFGVCNVNLTSTTMSAVIKTNSPGRLIAATTSYGIVIVPVAVTIPPSTTTTTLTKTPMQTVSGRFGFCGVSGSNCVKQRMRS